MFFCCFFWGISHLKDKKKKMSPVKISALSKLIRGKRDQNPNPLSPSIPLSSHYAYDISAQGNHRRLHLKMSDLEVMHASVRSRLTCILLFIYYATLIELFLLL